MVEIKELYKYYGNFVAVDNLNLVIPVGSIFGLVGPNGAGKTTTMSIMSGLLTATSGSLIINDVDVIQKPEVLKEKIGFMPDFFGVYDNLKVTEYMDFYEGTYGIPYKDRREITDNLLELVDLSDKKDAYVDTLSRGMKQRLCLARCLIHDPEVLILDEPASGLDPRARVEMKEIFKQLKQLGKTIIISSHILSDLAEMCTEVGIINKGKAIAYGNINEIMQKAKMQKLVYMKPLESAEELVRFVEQIPGVHNVVENTDNIEFAFEGDDRDLAEVVKRIIEAGIYLVSFREKEGNLEELFMELTSDKESDSLEEVQNA